MFAAYRLSFYNLIIKQLSLYVKAPGILEQAFRMGWIIVKGINLEHWIKQSAKTCRFISVGGN